MNEYLQPVIQFLEQWGWIPSSIIYIAVIITILIENRNPTKTMSWVMVIVFLPVVGIILYYLFGQKFSKVKKLKRINKEQSLRLKKEFQRLEPLMRWSIQNIQSKIGDFSRVFSYLKNERLSSPTLNNDVTLLVNGEEKFQHFLESLTAANHSIHMEYYIFDVDEIGTKVLDILEAKANAGVKVRLIVDSFGSPGLVRHMRRRAPRKRKLSFRPSCP